MSILQTEKPNNKLLAALVDARSRELRAAQLYRMLGNRQTDAHKRDLFIRLAEEEERHARQFGERIVANGGVLSGAQPSIGAMDRILVRTLGTESMLQRMEAEEERNMAAFESQAA